LEWWVTDHFDQQRRRPHVNLRAVGSLGHGVWLVDQSTKCFLVPGLGCL
jgi:hypothetical protein